MQAAASSPSRSRSWWRAASASGKTTLVGAVSEIRPLRTEEPLTEAGRPVDDIGGVEGKHTTTVAMDFGRITLREDLVLYLFGTPGQDRFWFLWDELAQGALGAVVLADTRRLEDCFAAVDYFERRGIPFVVAVNCFDGAAPYPAEDVREALDLDHDVPVVLCDARDRRSVRDVLVGVVQHAMDLRGRTPGDRHHLRRAERRPVPPPTGCAGWRRLDGPRSRDGPGASPGACARRRAAVPHRTAITAEPWPNRPWLAVMPTLAPSTWRPPAWPRSCQVTSHTWAMAWAGHRLAEAGQPAARVDRDAAAERGVAVAQQLLGLAVACTARCPRTSRARARSTGRRPRPGDRSSGPMPASS